MSSVGCVVRASTHPTLLEDAKMPADKPHPASLDEKTLLASCTSRRLRRSGPGGQHRNKVETAVVLTHEPSGVRAEANERRSQAENRAVALFRLRVNLALDVRASRAAETCPSRLWQSRCTAAGRINVAADHRDFPTMLAEALDTLERFHDDPKPAAEALGCTVSQLLKLLKKEPRAAAGFNQRRRQRGLRPLK